jgi:hypothetical protein
MPGALIGDTEYHRHTWRQYLGILFFARISPLEGVQSTLEETPKIDNLITSNLRAC